MDELSEALRGILEDPSQFAAIREMAQSLMGGEAPAAPPPEAAEARSSGNKAELVRALEPWLQPERAARLRKALRMAQAARLAAAALRRAGEDRHVPSL